MASKPKKPKPPTAAQLARERARALQGPTPPSQTIPNERHRPEKYKRHWERELDEGDESGPGGESA